MSYIINAGIRYIFDYDLKSKRRTNNIVRPRHIAMYLCRMETDENLVKIGMEFGGRDHSTVSTAIDKIFHLEQELLFFVIMLLLHCLMLLK